MSRSAFYEALVVDPVLNGMGINDDTVFHNWSNEERPTDATPFVILRWGIQAEPVFRDDDAGDVRAPELVTVWVHWPREVTNDYEKLVKALDAVDDCVKGMRDLPGNDGYTLSFVRVGGRSEDILDEGFNTIAKTSTYNVYSRKENS